MTTPEEADICSARKLRSVSAPDLKIIVGNDGDQQSFYYHSLLLAFHSDYVDAMLASPWTESKSRELTFPDIHPTVWKKMLAFLLDPMKGRLMAILLVTYSLKNQTKDYSDFFKAIQNNCTEWWHFLPDVWIVDTISSADQYARFLFPHIEKPDRLLVVKLSGERQGWLPKEAWDWLDQRRF